jgi:ATP synthase protein I
MLSATAIPMVVASPVIVAVFWLTRGTRGGLAGLLGVVVALTFFASGLYVMGKVTNANPFSVLAGALAVYLGQIIFLSVVILTLSGVHWLDGTAFGLSILAVALFWQVCQVVAFMRLRQPVYDLPAEHPVEVTDQEPARRGGTGEQ